MNLLRNLASFARMLWEEIPRALQPAPVEVATVTEIHAPRSTDTDAAEELEHG